MVRVYVDCSTSPVPVNFRGTTCSGSGIWSLFLFACVIHYKRFLVRASRAIWSLGFMLLRSFHPCLRLLLAFIFLMFLASNSICLISRDCLLIRWLWIPGDLLELAGFGFDLVLDLVLDLNVCCGSWFEKKRKEKKKMRDSKPLLIFFSDCIVAYKPRL